MVKTDFVKAIANKTGMRLEDARIFYDAFVECVEEALQSEDKKLILAGFGNFELQHRDTRTCKNPKTGEDIEVKGHDIPNFKFCKAFKEKF